MSDSDAGAERAGRQAEAERLVDEASRLARRAAGRAREEAKDAWAEAQALRKEEPGAGRRGLIYGIAGLINVGERLARVARGTAEGARAAQDEPAEHPLASSQPIEDEPGNSRPMDDDHTQR